jgi:hypothetical protein
MEPICHPPEQEPVTQTNGDLWLFIYFSAVIGAFVGWILATWVQNDRKNEWQEERPQQIVSTTVNWAWDDGVMWGALAAKNLGDMNIQVKDFDVVVGKAKELKVKFMATASKKDVLEAYNHGKIR